MWRNVEGHVLNWTVPTSNWTEIKLSQCKMDADRWIVHFRVILNFKDRPLWSN